MREAQETVSATPTYTGYWFHTWARTDDLRLQPACCQLHHMNFTPIVFPLLTLHGFYFHIVDAILLPMCRLFRSGEPRSRSPSTSLRTICFQGSPGTPARLTLHWRYVVLRSDPGCNVPQNLAWTSLAAWKSPEGTLFTTPSLMMSVDLDKKMRMCVDVFIHRHIYRITRIIGHH